MSRRKRTSFRRRAHKPYGLVERERTESERVVAAMVEINREIDERCAAAAHARHQAWASPLRDALNKLTEGMDDEVAWTFANWGPDRPREVDVEVLDMTNRASYRRPPLLLEPPRSPA
ncbi:MAG: hypothetical protein K9G48_05405 [Reyranella sp.]|nr:hypothetical protein [Reyranella sp.]